MARIEHQKVVELADQQTDHSLHNLLAVFDTHKPVTLQLQMPGLKRTPRASALLECASQGSTAYWFQQHVNRWSHCHWNFSRLLGFTGNLNVSFGIHITAVPSSHCLVLFLQLQHKVQYHCIRVIFSDLDTLVTSITSPSFSTCVVAVASAVGIMITLQPGVFAVKNT